jgi:hypothetical protein
MNLLFKFLTMPHLLDFLKKHLQQIVHHIVIVTNIVLAMCIYNMNMQGSTHV